jgi:integrase
MKRFFHDFRRTAARNMDRAGVPRDVAKKILGHKTDSMYTRYRIVDEAETRENIRRTQRYIHEVGTSQAQ